MRITKEFTKEELMAMPLIALRRLDIDTPQQQEMVQEIVNIKLQALPPQRPVFRRDVPDIQTPQEEERWQTIMNQREAKIKGQVETPAAPVEVPATPVETPPVIEPTSPNEAAMAQPTGEGDPVTISTGVSQVLTQKLDKRTKAYRDSLNK